MLSIIRVYLGEYVFNILKEFNSRKAPSSDPKYEKKTPNNDPKNGYNYKFQ